MGNVRGIHELNLNQIDSTRHKSLYSVTLDGSLFVKYRMYPNIRSIIIMNINHIDGKRRTFWEFWEAEYKYISTCRMENEFQQDFPNKSR